MIPVIFALLGAILFVAREEAAEILSAIFSKLWGTK
jgi:hypothetical protein